jgi:hypothetical protein
MPLPGRHGPVNTGVALHDEAAADARAVREFAGVERIFWVQCPRCRLRLWYALRYDTGQAEIQYFGAAFRRRLLSEACDGHSRAPLPESEAGAWKKREA